MNIDSNYVVGFKSVIEDIVKTEVKKTGITTYISAIVQKVNNNGTVDVFLPPDKQNLVTGIFNRCGEKLFVGDSVEIATKNGSLTNAWVFVKHGTNINGSSEQLEEMASEIVVKVSNGRLKTTALDRNASLGNSLTIVSDDINLDGMNINLNGTRGITITSPYFTVTKTGVIGATSGTIGGWTLGTTKLSSGTGTNYVGLDSGTNGQDYAIWAGNATASNAPFSVTRVGKVKASNIEITGGSLSIGSAFGVTSAGAVTASNIAITGGSLSIGSDFGVTNTGVLTASNVTISGAITATSGTIGGCTISGGTLQIANANIGSLSVDKITAGTNSASLTFNGNVTCSNISANGGTIGGWNISTVQLQKSIGRYSFEIRSDRGSSEAALLVYDTSNSRYNFYVQPNGYLYARSAEINGTIYSSSGTIGGFTLGSTSLSGSTSKGTMTIRRGTSASVDLPANGGRLMLASSANNGVYLTSANTLLISDNYSASEQVTSNDTISIRAFNGTVHINSNYGVYAGNNRLDSSSSRKIKENIKKMPQKYINEIYKSVKEMPLYIYDYKDGYGFKDEFGFIIEDLENTCLKRTLKIEQSKDNKLIKYYNSEDLNKMNLVLIKELMNEIENLKEEIKNMKR